MLYLVMSFPAVLVGVVFLCMAVRKHRWLLDLRRRAGARADGRVAGQDVASSGGPGSRWGKYYVYEFMVNGRPQRGQFPGSRHLQAGGAVTFFYDPACPERICIPQYQQESGLPGLYFLGGGWAVIGVLLFAFWMLGIQ